MRVQQGRVAAFRLKHISLTSKLKSDYALLCGLVLLCYVSPFWSLKYKGKLTTVLILLHSQRLFSCRTSHSRVTHSVWSVWRQVCSGPLILKCFALMLLMVLCIAMHSQLEKVPNTCRYFCTFFM